ncbi:hypothetical protein OPT61_g9323 [Boeremia exigua]|uniref:Uncharacterized protein n=1 Tax=Boeremia exigua TaxID=749465 RepID=A0ACC2HUX1_9PLEO|nr:hypothetical protein OPT61_g9323 [Boeremia exigua]
MTPYWTILVCWDDGGGAAFTKTHPENHIARRLPVNPANALDPVRQHNERDLQHHAEKRDADDVVRGDADEEFVQDAGNKKDGDLGQGGWDAAPDEGGVDVPPHEVCHGLVPGGPVGANRRDVPPGPVEFAVGEAHYFCEGVEGGLEEREEAAQPAEDADGAEFHDALEDGGEVEGDEFVEGVLEEGGGILRRRKTKPQRMEGVRGYTGW